MPIPAFFAIYGRVLGLLRPVRGLAVTLTLANLALAAVPFIDPILFGKAIDLLTNAAARGAEATFHDGVRIFGLWAAVGVGGIGARILVSLHADRLAHRQRLDVTARFFEHVLQLHLAYHRRSHSGRLLKVMLQNVRGRSSDTRIIYMLALRRVNLALEWFADPSPQIRLRSRSATDFRSAHVLPDPLEPFG